jgi:hypothetical protein
MRAVRILAAVCALTLSVATPGFAQDAALADKPVRWQAPTTDGWALAWPADQTKVTYQGVVSFDKAGNGPGAMVYVGVGGVAGLFVSVLAHVAINEGVKNSQKTAMQVEADKVLADYKATLDAFTPDDLMQRTTKALGASTPALRDAAGARWSLEVMPLYRMTQDRRALMVDAVVTVRSSSAADVVTRSAVRVIASPHAAESVAQVWSDNDGAALKAESAELLSQAVTLALSDMSGQWDASTAAQRTIRFPEGGAERIERAQVLQQQCGRAVVRTLRGDLMAVPMNSPDGAASTGCSPSAESAALNAPTAATRN